MSAFTRIRRSFQRRTAAARSMVIPPATIRRAAIAAIEPMEARQLMSASSFDTAFSGNGKATAALANFNGAATSVDVGKDGSVFVASSAGEDFVITKFLANGNLDTNWGTNGRATVDFGGMDTAADIAATNYGGCVITGQSYIGGHTYMAVAKLNTDGSTYNGFDGDGRKLIQFEVDTYYGDVDSDSVGASLVIQDDGRIVVAGTAYFQIPNYNVTDSVVAVARLNSNGSFDTSFSGDGKMTHEYFKYQPYQRDSAYAVTLDQSARILVGGASEGSWSMVRLLANGSVDGSFEQANVTMGSSGQINAIDVAAGGRIFAAGYAYTQATGSDWAIACFKSNGGLKQGFDGDGRMIIPINGAYSTETLTGIAWQNNNKIVVAGTGSISGAAVDMTVLKMHDTGVADTSFGFAGYKFIE